MKVTCITQDNNGYVWVGTEDGLNRFDGFFFSTYKNDPGDSLSLKTNHVTSLFIDSEGTLWIGTTEGTLCYEPEINGFSNPSLGLPDNYIKDNHCSDIMEDRQGRLWFTPSGIGVVSYSLKDKQAKVFASQAGDSATLCSKYIQTILEDKKGRIWMGSRADGISVYDPAKGTYVNYNSSNSGLCGNSISDLALLSNGDVLITSIRGGACIYDARKDKITGYPDVFCTADSRSVLCGLEDNDGNIILGTENSGALVFDPEKRTLEQHPGIKENSDLYSDTKVFSMFKGFHNYLWLALHYKGLLCIGHEESGFKSLRKINDNPNSLNCRAVTGITTDKGKRVWIATDGGGLNMYDPAKDEFIHYTYSPTDAASISDNAVNCVLCDSKDRIWAGTFTGGLCLFDRDTETFTRFQKKPGGLQSDRIHGLAEDRNGNIWIATFGGGIACLDPETMTFKTYFYSDNPGLVNDYIYHLFIDSKQRLWIGTFYGLSYMDIRTETFHAFNRTNGLSSIVIHSIAEDAEGTIWAGTANGLNKYDENSNSFTLEYPTRNELSSTINGVVPYGNDLWMSTNHGIIRFTPSVKEVKRYYYNSGLSHNEFIAGSYHTGKDGRIFFGGIEGLNFFFPDDIYNYDAASSVIITNLMIDNAIVGINDKYDGDVVLEKSIAYTKKIKLNYKVKIFTLDYVAMGIFDSYSVVYAYKLEGFDKDWIYTDYRTRSVSYTNLNPGTYSFRIKSSSNPDVWGDDSTVTTLIIEITPAPWNTWWAKVLYVLFFLAATFLVLRFIFIRIRDKNELRIQRLQTEQQKEINEVRTGFFTNISHEFRTPLTLIIGPLQRMIEEESNEGKRKKGFLILRNAERLLRLVNQILDVNKIEDGKLRLHVQRIELVSFVSNSIGTFTELAKIKHTALTYKWNVDEIFVWYDADMLDKCLNNILYNAYKFTPDGGKISVELRKTDDGQVEVIIRDTGIGMKPETLEHIFDRFYQGNEGQYSGTGIGMHLTKTIVELHKGSIDVESEEGKGSCFTIHIRLGKDHFTPEEITGQNAGAEDRQAEEDKKTTEYFKEYYSLAGSASGAKQKIKDSEPFLLLIEDDADMRLYIRQELEDKYQIEEAVNGIEGLMKARHLMPDLIISDVMMPEMNGRELCRMLKADKDTCHIPVILLTAQTEMEQRIEGLETGADSYISKPFSTEYLKVRIDNLLDIRKKLKERFSKSINIDPKELTLASLDERLLQNVIEYIRKNIENSELSVETMSKDLGFSRTHLHRKLKALTGQSPIEFIKMVRMKQAAYLLGTGKLTVSEIAYKVGYNTPSYFSNSFSAYFGMSPTEYIEKKQPQQEE